MGKQGPCYHCGVTSTPLWRNGPPEKPVLCNACGSRWRTKGTLANYTPLHARAEADEYEDHRASTVMTVSLKRGDEKLKKRKICFVDTSPRRYASENNQNFLKITDEDTSIRSSSGSAVSNSESCSLFNSADVSDSTGPAQSVVWDTQVPSRKRTCVTRPKSSPVEKLIKDLHAILEKQRSSYLPSYPEEDLLFESEGPLVSVEIGHGSVLIKHPSSLLQEEESEASSFSFENQYSGISACSNSVSLSGCDNFKGDTVCYHGNEKFRRLRGEMMHQDFAMRGRSSDDWTQLWWTQDSPLIHIDLRDVINFEVLVGQFTSDEQRQLFRYLPPTDASKLPGSLESMFGSSGFAEDLSCLQQLLSEGFFNSIYTGVETEDIKILNKLVISGMTKSAWVELYSKLKYSKFNHQAEHVPESKSDLPTAKRRLQEQSQCIPDNETTKDPRLPDSQRNMLEVPDDEDLLVDVPNNNSFPQAEFLLPTSTTSSSIHPAFVRH